MHDVHATEQMLWAQERAVVIPAGRALLPGTLAWPDHPSGLVLFAHGSGRRSPRHQRLVRHLRAAGLGTLLFDLLTEEESAEHAGVFDIGLLAERLLAATDWVTGEPDTEALPLGYFGTGTGAAAALRAAGRSPGAVGAVVCRGGRADLAGEDLPLVAAPTLLIVGDRDPAVLALNRQALACLMCSKRLVVVPGATHHFEEPGTLEEAGMWTAEWFVHYLAMEPTWRKARQ